MSWRETTLQSGLVAPCRRCDRAVPPEHVQTHLWKKHKIDCSDETLNSIVIAHGLMSLDSIKTVAVLGAGTMGNGIAHVFARAGYDVILRDVDQRYLDRALDTISRNLDRFILQQGSSFRVKSRTQQPLHWRFLPVTGSGCSNGGGARGDGTSSQSPGHL